MLRTGTKGPRVYLTEQSSSSSIQFDVALISSSTARRSTPSPRAAPRRRLAPLSPAECRRRLEPRSAAAANAATPRPRPEPRTVRSDALSSDDPSSTRGTDDPRPRHEPRTYGAPPPPSSCTDPRPCRPSRGPFLRRVELRSSPAGTELAVIVVPGHVYL